MAKRVSAEHALHKDHGNHENHMCDIVAKRKMDQAADLAKDAKYICHICGRATARPENLCEPVEI